MIDDREPTYDERDLLFRMKNWWEYDHDHLIKEAGERIAALESDNTEMMTGLTEIHRLYEADSDASWRASLMAAIARALVERKQK